MKKGASRRFATESKLQIFRAYVAQRRSKRALFWPTVLLLPNFISPVDGRLSLGTRIYRTYTQGYSRGVWERRKNKTRSFP